MLCRSGVVWLWFPELAAGITVMESCVEDGRRVESGEVGAVHNGIYLANERSGNGHLTLPAFFRVPLRSHQPKKLQKGKTAAAINPSHPSVLCSR